MHADQKAKALPRGEDEDLFPCEHKTEIALSYVVKNNLGETVYGMYIKDTQNLSEPVGLELTVYPDGRKQVNHNFDPEDLLPENAVWIDKTNEEETDVS